MRAQVAANSGAARLVPPYCALLPLTMMMAPEFGSATKATSATSRVVPPPWVCQLGLGSTVLGLPPAPLHSVSLTQLFDAPVLSEVPLPAMTYGEQIGRANV